MEKFFPSCCHTYNY